MWLGGLVDRLKNQVTSVPGDAGCVFLLLLIGLVPLSWFRGSQLLAGNDFFPGVLATEFVKGLYIWDDFFGGTISMTPATTIFPGLAFWGTFSFLGVAVAERVWLVLLYTLTLQGMYFLLSQITPRFRASTKFVATLFYGFNLFFMVYFGIVQAPYLYVSGLIPLLTGSLVKMLKSGDVRWALLLGIFSMVGASVNANPAFYISAWIIPISYGIFWVLSRMFSLSITWRRIRLLALATGATIMMNAYWIVSLVIAWATGKIIGFELEGFRDALSSQLSFLSVMRYTGWWRWATSLPPYLSYSLLYETNPVLIILTFVPAVLAFGSLLRALKVFDYIFFMIASVIATYLIMGAFLSYSHLIPLLRFFRTPHSKFSCVQAVSYTVMIAFSVECLLRQPQSTRWAIALAILACANGWPFLSGDLIATDVLGRADDINLRTDVPSYWFEMGDHIAQLEDDGRLLLLPPASFYIVNYNWNYRGVDPALRIIEKPIIAVEPGRPEVVANVDSYLLIEVLLEYPELFEPLSNLFDIRYTLVRGDLNWHNFGYRPTYSPEEAMRRLEDGGWLREQTLGELALYTRQNMCADAYVVRQFTLLDVPRYEDLVPFAALLARENPGLIFSTRVLTASVDFETRSFTVSYEPNPIPAEVQYEVVDTDSQIYTGSIASDDSEVELPAIVVSEVNPTYYVIQIEGAQEPYGLVFRQSFHPGWVASVHVANGRSYIIPPRDHFQSDGYANGWWVKQTGDYEIHLTFKYQMYLRIGHYISVTTLVTSLVILIVLSWRKYG
jgi:hypothetical protein